MPTAMDKTDRKGTATGEGCEDRHREKGYSPPIKSHMPIWKHREIILSAWNCYYLYHLNKMRVSLTH